jgi:hypothetical protein
MYIYMYIHIHIDNMYIYIYYTPSNTSHPSLIHRFSGLAWAILHLGPGLRADIRAVMWVLINDLMWDLMGKTGWAR